MFTALAAFGPLAGHVAGPFWFIGPIFGLLWFALIVTVIVLLVRRGRRGPWGGGWGGPWGHGHGYGPWAAAQAARSAESTLAERFAQGDIDEKEYRARLEVLRASAPQPPAPQA